MTEKEQTAYHEAGHAVVSYRLRPDNGYGISIIAKDGSLGRFFSEGLINNTDECLQEVIILYAGYAAEKAFSPDTSPGGSCDDDEKAQGLLVHIDESEDKLRGQAADLIRENWRAVEAIASMLMRHEELAWEEWQEIIDVVDGGKDWEAAFYRTREAMQVFKK